MYSGTSMEVVEMDAGVTVGGDSGAPWFIDNKGVGVHFGLENHGRSIFSKLVWADDGLGADYQVMLN